jgi:hypothetical protein
MKKQWLVWIGMLLCAPFLGCRSAGYTSVAFSTYEVKKVGNSSGVLQQLLKRAKDEVNDSLAKVIACSVQGFRQQPNEYTLENWVADAVRYTAEKTVLQPVDLVLISRAAVGRWLPRGNITLQNIYQLIPGNFRWVIHTVRVDSLETFLDSALRKNGYGISGSTLRRVGTGGGVQIRSRGQLLLPTSHIHVITLQRLSYQPAKEEFFQFFPTLYKGTLLREAVIFYAASFTQAGQPVKVSLEKRIDVQ